jgi:hypothetical protein
MISLRTLTNASLRGLVFPVRAVCATIFIGGHTIEVMRTIGKVRTDNYV